MYLEEIAELPTRIKNEDAELVGQSIGNYRIKALLDTTKKSMVFLAEDRTLKIDVALKLLSSSQSPERKEQFINEWKRHAQVGIRHPQVARVFAAGEDNGYHFLAMEYVDGMNLHELVKAPAPLSLRGARKIIHDSTVAVAYCHQHNINHEDVKLKNIKQGRDGSVLLLDFGGCLTQKTDDVIALGKVGEALLQKVRHTEEVPKSLDTIITRAVNREYAGPEELQVALEQDEHQTERVARHRLTRRRFMKALAIPLGAAIVGHLACVHLEEASISTALNTLKKDGEDKHIRDIEQLRLEIFDQKVRWLAKEKIAAGKFPYGTTDSGAWMAVSTPSYSNGFWPAMLWEGYKTTKDPQFNQWAREWTEAIQLSPEDKKHATAVRFFYSHAQAHTVTKEDKYKQHALEALDVLLEAPRTPGSASGSMVVATTNAFDVVPFLLWGYKVSGDERYRKTAEQELQKIFTYSIDERGSVKKYATVHPEKHTVRMQNCVGSGNKEESIARVHAQLMHGAATVARALNDTQSLEMTERLSASFDRFLSEKTVPVYSVHEDGSRSTYIDSSAGAIAAHTFKQLAHITGKRSYEQKAQALWRALALECLSPDTAAYQGVLRQGCLNPTSKIYENHSLIFGDYYFLKGD